MRKLFPPFDPDGQQPGRQRARQLQIPIRLLLPNMVTLLALCAGLTAIRMAVEGNFDFAIYGILFAAALDGIDGRVARLLRSTSRFGAQLDSLTDFVNFGVAPAIVLYIWGLGDLGSIGWIVAIVFAISAALRLARFNAALEGPAKPAWHAAYFVGVPAPAGAVVALLPIYVEFLGVPHGAWTAPVVLIYTVAIALLMISRVPSWSGKLIGQKIPRDLVLPLFLALVVTAALLVSFPWLAISIACLVYLATLPISWAGFHRQHQAMVVEAAALAKAADQSGPLQLEAPPRARAPRQRTRSGRSRS
ncbi:MAG: phosphatidylcholine/phosphatidylserine synthase [Bauldia sp.]